MTRVSRSTSTITSSKNITSRSSKKNKASKNSTTNIKTNQERGSGLCEIDNLRLLFQNNPEEAIQLLNQKILLSHPLGNMLSDASCKRIATRISKVISDDNDSSEYINKLLGG
ncbi:hypothetical protein [Photobacterium kasasachensis]|uniref:hypothetical protein n=1 Tax=Photobacterium kasasachensis TaxID=2910240 RepID=UPI003D12CEE7